MFVEQTNRSIMVGGAPVDVTRLSNLPADALVVDQVLPPEDVWVEAAARAQADFGIAGPPNIRTARNAGLLATDRGRLAGVALRLVESARAAAGHVAVLEALTDADLGGFAAQHLGPDHRIGRGDR